MTTRLIAVLVAALGFATSSAAAPITWEFEGTVRYVSLGTSSAVASSLGVSVGASAFGRVVYESTTPEITPGGGSYSGALIEFDVSIGSYSPSGLGLGAFFDFYVRQASWPPTAPYGFEFAMGNGTTDVLFPTGPIVTLSVIPNVPGVIVNSSLPTAPPALSVLRPFSIADWLEAGFGFGTGIQLYRASPDEEVMIEFTRLEAVPEPFTFVLLAPLAVALATSRRGRRS